MRFSIFPLVLLAYLLIEISVMIAVGSEIGILATLGLILLSGFLGIFLMRWQGFGLLAKIQAESSSGRMPGRDLVHGVMILLAGFLLLLPGFVTDILGLLLFIPPIREFVWQLIRSRINILSTGFPGGLGGFSRPGSKSGPGNSYRNDEDDPNIVDLDDEDYHRTDMKRDRRREIDHHDD